MATLNRAGVLCALLFAFQAALAQTTDISLPPEDLDSSGDDDDSFSGSGAGSLPLGAVVPRQYVPLQESINSSLSPSMTTDMEDDDYEAHGTERPLEDYERVPVSPTNIHVLLVNDPLTDKPAVTVVEEGGVFTEQATTSSAVVTARIPVTHHTSTLRIATSHTSSTVGDLKPEVFHGFHHGHDSDRETSVFDAVPTTNSPEATSSTTTPSMTTPFVPIKDISSLPEEEVFAPVDDGSGDQDDFLIEKENNSIVEQIETDSRAVDPGATDLESAGASQGLMGRKDVLAGVIAGGLVGLLFAGFLVGFMLYRMKKKDEGSYSLDEPKQSNGGYQKPHKQEEFYA